MPLTRRTLGVCVHPALGEDSASPPRVEDSDRHPGSRQSAGTVNDTGRQKCSPGLRPGEGTCREDEQLGQSDPDLQQNQGVPHNKINTKWWHPRLGTEDSGKTGEQAGAGVRQSGYGLSPRPAA